MLSEFLISKIVLRSNRYFRNTVRNANNILLETLRHSECGKNLHTLINLSGN